MLLEGNLSRLDAWQIQKKEASRELEWASKLNIALRIFVWMIADHITTLNIFYPVRQLGEGGTPKIQYLFFAKIWSTQREGGASTK